MLTPTQSRVVADAGLTKGASVAGRRKSYGARKVQSEVVSSHRRADVKRASMPCVKSDCRDDGSKSQQMLRHEHHVRSRRPAARAADRFYSAAVDESEEWAQVSSTYILLLVFRSSMSTYLPVLTGKGFILKSKGKVCTSCVQSIPSVLLHCWLGDRKVIQPVNVLVWQFQRF